MSQYSSHDRNLRSEEAMDHLLPRWNECLRDVRPNLSRMLPDDARWDGLAPLLWCSSGDLERHTSRRSSSTKRGFRWPREQEAVPEAVRCANPACSQTFWKWRASDSQRYCSPACVRHGHPLLVKPSKPTQARRGGGRANPAIAASNRRRGAAQRESQAHAYALQLLAEAGLFPADQEDRSEGGAGVSAETKSAHADDHPTAKSPGRAASG